MKDNSRFIITEDSTYFQPDDLQCKSCRYRDRSFDEGYMKGTCTKYRGLKDDRSDMKPRKILFMNEKCDFYKRDE